jgi:hypothetical protein
MVMHVHATVSAVFFVVLSILMALGARGRAIADSVCIEQPDRDAPQGEHWYYHYDREKNRKCWHVGPNAAPVAHDGPPTPRTERSHTLASTLNAMFAPVVRSVRNFFRQPMPHEASAGEPRIVQSDATKPLTIEDIAQQPEFPEERAETRQVVTSLTPAQRKALFDEYMKWETLQSDSGAAMPVSARSP